MRYRGIEALIQPGLSGGGFFRNTEFVMERKERIVFLSGSAQQAAAFLPVAGHSSPPKIHQAQCPMRMTSPW